MRQIAIILMLICLTCACNTEQRLLKRLSETNTIEQAKNLQYKYSKQESEIRKVDGTIFYNDPIFQRLKPGHVFRIGNQADNGANIYKLLESPASDSAYYVLIIHSKS